MYTLYFEEMHKTKKKPKVGAYLLLVDTIASSNKKITCKVYTCQSYINCLCNLDKKNVHELSHSIFTRFLSSIHPQFIFISQFFQKSTVVISFHHPLPKPPYETVTIFSGNILSIVTTSQLIMHISGHHSSALLRHAT